MHLTKSAAHELVWSSLLCLESPKTLRGGCHTAPHSLMSGQLRHWNWVHVFHRAVLLTIHKHKGSPLAMAVI